MKQKKAVSEITNTAFNIKCNYFTIIFDTLPYCEFPNLII